MNFFVGYSSQSQLSLTSFRTTFLLQNCPWCSLHVSRCLIYKVLRCRFPYFPYFLRQLAYNTTPPPPCQVVFSPFFRFFLLKKPAPRCGVFPQESTTKSGLPDFVPCLFFKALLRCRQKSQIRGNAMTEQILSRLIAWLMFLAAIAAL